MRPLARVSPLPASSPPPPTPSPVTYTHLPTDRAKQCFEVNYFGSMRFIQTFLPALREAPGQGARIVYIRAHITHPLTQNYSGLTYTYQTTYHYLANTSRAFQAAALSPGCMPMHPSCSSFHPGARIVQISSLAGLTTAPGVAVNLWVGKVATQTTREGHQRLTHGRPFGL